MSTATASSPADCPSPWTMSADATSSKGDSMDPRSLAFTDSSDDGGSGFGAPGGGQHAKTAAEALADAMHDSNVMTTGSNCSAGCSFAAAADSAGSADEPQIRATIVSTSNQLEEEPWMPVRGIITMFRIQVRHGDERQWDVLRRYTDFNELHLHLTRAFDPATVPPLPPKLLINSDESIAERYLELDTYLRALLASPLLSKHGRFLDFLGVEKQGVRYGVRRYEYDSAHSEGNRYIRDTDL